jgi:hypothetical protein
MLTAETIRSQDIQHGAQLRVYNAVYIPTSINDAVDQNSNESGGVIVCTQLCEEYPKSVLPQLVVALVENLHRVDAKIP